MQEDISDIERAKQILSQNNPTFTQDEVEKEFGFDFSAKRKSAVEALKKLREGRSLAGVSPKELVEEGCKH